MSVSSAEPLRVLLVKPYQRARLRIACPLIQAEFPGTIVAIGGRFTHGNTEKICATRRLRLDLRRRSGLVVSNCLSAVVSRRQNSNRYKP